MIYFPIKTMVLRARENSEVVMIYPDDGPQFLRILGNLSYEDDPWSPLFPCIPLDTKYESTSINHYLLPSTIVLYLLPTVTHIIY